MGSGWEDSDARCKEHRFHNSQDNAVRRLIILEKGLRDNGCEIAEATDGSGPWVCNKRAERAETLLRKYLLLPAGNWPTFTTERHALDEEAWKLVGNPLKGHISHVEWEPDSQPASGSEGEEPT